MTIDGEGRHPQKTHVMNLAKAHSIPAKRANDILSEVLAASDTWNDQAQAVGLSVKKQQEIATHIERNKKLLLD